MAETKLREALDLLRRDGWWGAGNYPASPPRPHCVGLALAVEFGYRSRSCREVEDDPGFRADARALAASVREHYPERIGEGGSLWAESGSIAADTAAFVAFNNHRNTTFPDVERVMEKAAIAREEAV